MKHFKINVSSNYIIAKKNFNLSIELPEEAEVLDLYESFLAKRMYQYTVKNVAAGRHLLEPLIKSLLPHYKIGYLSLEPKSFMPGVCSMLEEIALIGDRYDAEVMEQFMLNYFYYDFFWIECTTELMSQSWFLVLRHLIVKYDLDCKQPLLVINYLEC